MSFRDKVTMVILKSWDFSVITGKESMISVITLLLACPCPDGDALLWKCYHGCVSYGMASTGWKLKCEKQIFSWWELSASKINSVLTTLISWFFCSFLEDKNMEIQRMRSGKWWHLFAPPCCKNQPGWEIDAFYF